MKKKNVPVTNPATSARKSPARLYAVTDERGGVLSVHATHSGADQALNGPGRMHHCRGQVEVYRREPPTPQDTYYGLRREQDEGRAIEWYTAKGEVPSVSKDSRMLFVHRAEALAARKEFAEWEARSVQKTGKYPRSEKKAWKRHLRKPLRLVRIKCLQGVIVGETR